jgi:hypothetical protein
METNRSYTEYEDASREETTDEQQQSKKRSSYYPSNVHGMFIVNAITGVEYRWRVGTKDARCLFHVVDTMGTHDKNGRKLKINSPQYPNPNPNNYYYDSPQQFMQHRKTKLNPVLVEKWHSAQQEFATVIEEQ